MNGVRPPPLRPARRAWWWVLALALVQACAGQGACVGPFALIVATGQFKDRTVFSPNGTGFVVLDRRREVRQPDGSITVEERDDPRVIVVLTAVQFDPEVDLAAMPPAHQEDLLGALRVGDMIILQDLAASRVSPGITLESNRPSTGRDTFTFFLQRPKVAGATTSSWEDAPPIGTRRRTAASSAGSAESPPQALGRVDFNLELQAERGADQEPAEGQGVAVAPSTGTVDLRCNLPVIQERVGRSNVAFIKRALREQ